MVAQKIGTIILYALTLPNINRFSKLFHWHNQKKIYNRNPTTSQLCCYTTLWNVKCLKSKNRKQDDVCSVTTHFKQLTTGNNVLIVSVIVQSNCHLLQLNVSALLLDGALWLVAWLSGRTLVFGRRTFSVLRSTCSWRVTMSAMGQPTRPTQPFIPSGSID